MKAMIIAEHAEAARGLAAGARELANEVVAVVVGAEATPVGIADEAYHLTVPAEALADDADATLAPLIEGVSLVIGESSRRVKSIVGKLAARSGAAVVTNVQAFAEGSASSLYFGGIAQITRTATTSVAFYTAEPGVFTSAEAFGAAVAQELTWVVPAAAAKKLATELLPKASVDLHTVKVVVAAGRGFAEQESLVFAHEFCNKVGGGLGCTRPLAEAVDWFDKEAYIGVSGLMLSPKVYIGVGVSGQMQHIIGVNRAEKVFAINKDKNAPIFKQCDLGIVGDLNVVLPALTAFL